MQNHELNEQLMLINQLDEDEKNVLIKIINSMLTKKRMKDLLEGKWTSKIFLCHFDNSLELSVQHKAL